MYSEIDGFGLFAAESINKGEIMWEFNPIIDKTYIKEEVETLPKHVQDFFAKYAATAGDNFYLWLDNTRFTNHSNKPNTLNIDHKLIAAKNIEMHEEITQKYSNFTRD